MPRPLDEILSELRELGMTAEEAGQLRARLSTVESFPLFEIASNPSFPATRAEFRSLVGGMLMRGVGLPVPGWLRPGLFLRHPRTNLLFVVTGTSEECISLRRPPGVNENNITCGYENLHDLWLATQFFECDDCRRKPGSPVLCQDCLDRRSSSGPHMRSDCRLPKYCSTAYDGAIPLQEQVPEGGPPLPSRFDREEPI